jgi:hypothetical protein
MVSKKKKDTEKLEAAQTKCSQPSLLTRTKAQYKHQEKLKVSANLEYKQN